MKNRYIILLCFLFLSAAPAAFAQDPVVYLPLDADLNDASGNELNGTDAGTEPTSFVEDPERGMVANFPAAAHVQLPLDPKLNFGTEDFTVSFWIKIDNTVIPGGDPVIMSNKDWGSGGNPGFLIGLDGANDATAHLWTVNVADGAGGRLDWDADDNQTPNLVDGKWHFVAVAFDRDSTMNVYLDGELRQTDPEQDSKDLNLIPGSLSTDNLPLTLMQDGTGAYGDDFAALMDEVRIWKGKALSAEEILEVFNFASGGQGNQTYGADVYLPLDTDLNDLSGHNINATDAGTVETSFTNDPERGDVALFPAAAHAQFPLDPLLDFGVNDFSVSFWIKINPDVSIPSDPVIMSNKDWGSGGNPGFLIGLDGADDPAAHLWTVNVADGAGGRLDWDADDNQTPNLKDGTWHLVAVAFDRDSTMNVYFDGELRQTDPEQDSKDLNLVPGSLSGAGLPLTIMQDGTGAYGDDFAALLDNIRVWNRVITPEEVAVIFAEDKGNGSGEGSGEIVLGTDDVEQEADISLTVYPNPVVENQASITYQLPSASNITITVYDRAGKKIQTLVKKEEPAGEHTLIWNTSAYNSGLYYFQIEGDNMQKTSRVILVK